MKIYQLLCGAEERLDDLTSTQLSRLPESLCYGVGCTDAPDLKALMEQVEIILFARANGIPTR